MAAGKWKLTAPVTRLRARIAPRGDCWEFRGACSSAGYGQLSVDGNVVYAHRIAYQAAKGPIPPRYDVDHICRHTWCVRPSHLEAVPHRVNVQRGLRGVLKTHCSQGHPWMAENIYHRPRGGRDCAVCRRERNAKWNAVYARPEA